MKTGAKPKVSTIVITYNQQAYIGQALQSIIDQKTDFLHEIIVADDGSSDDTPKIINEFAKKYPETIIPILRRKNIGAWQNFVDAIRQAKGDYIAMCEGDDYWTDPKKLEVQVRYLDTHEDYALCFHPVKITYEHSRKTSLFPESGNARKFTLHNLLKGNFIQTNSVMYRRQDYRHIATHEIMPGDWYLHLFHARFGKIGWISSVMSVYRRHSEGLWWESQKKITNIWRRHGIGHLYVYQELLEMFGDNKLYRNIINDHINTMFDNILRLENADELKARVLDEFPEMSRSYTLELHTKYANKVSELEEQRRRLQTDIHHRNLEINKLTHELNLIKGSKTWRARNKLIRFRGK